LAAAGIAAVKRSIKIPIETLPRMREFSSLNCRGVGCLRAG
jgi:hypothetical protein